MATVVEKRIDSLEASDIKMSEILHELQMNVQKLTLLLEAVIKHNDQVDEALKSNQDAISHVAAAVDVLENAEKVRVEEIKNRKDVIARKTALWYAALLSLFSAVIGAGTGAYIAHLLHP